MDLQDFKDLIRTTLNEVLNGDMTEMARIANLVKLGDPALAKEARETFKDTWVEKMIDHLEKNPNGATKVELAQASGKPRQQDVNPVINRLLTSGVFVMGDYSSPKKDKAPTSGVKGRPVVGLDALTDEEKLKRLIKQIKNHLRGVELSSGNPSPAPRESDVNWFKEKFQDKYEDLYSSVEAYVTKPSIETEDAIAKIISDLGFSIKKRGRPVNTMKKSKTVPPPSEDIPLEEMIKLNKLIQK